MKNDSGSYAVFTEQGSSASQMTAAKVMDVIARLPGCAGQAADPISAKSQVKMECKQHTAPRASITCHTREFSRRVHVAQDV